MNIDLTVLISISSALLGMFIALYKKKKDSKEDTEKKATEQTIVSTKLDYISKGVDDIRLDMKAQDKKINGVVERLIKVEESTKSAHHRIDEIEER